MAHPCRYMGSKKNAGAFLEDTPEDQQLSPQYGEPHGWVVTNSFDTRQPLYNSESEDKENSRVSFLCGLPRERTVTTCSAPELFAIADVACSVAEV